MNYKYTDYNNFDELMDCDSQTANLLLIAIVKPQIFC